MIFSKPSIILDVDGTFYDKFARDDKKIIEAIFNGNVIVKYLDSFLWSINRLDVFTNSMLLLNIRLFIYALICFKRFSYVKEAYRIRYDKLIKCHLNSYRKYLVFLSENYELLFITNNKYTVKSMFDELDFICKYCPNMFSRWKVIKDKSKISNIAMMVGNNYMDDILAAKIAHIKSVYIGNSKFKKIFKADFKFKTFKEFIYKMFEIS